MKYYSLTIAAFALLATDGFAQFSTTPAASQLTRNSYTAPHEETVNAATITVKPGEKKDNGDVTVDNHKDSKNDAKINGDNTKGTNVRLKKDFVGNVSGLDSNDEILMGPNTTQPGGMAEKDKPLISGTGGDISWGNNAEGWVKNTAKQGGNNITITLVSGDMVSVAPGQNKWIQ